MRDRLVGTALISTFQGVAGVALAATLAGCSFTSPDAATGSQFVGIDGVSAPEARRIAKEAYVYGYPMVASYQAVYATNIDSTGSQYRGPFNTFHHVARVYTPEDAGIAAPNLETATSSAVLDLRAEPVVVSVPPMESRRLSLIHI